MSDTPWWQDAVFYQIYPRSFADASGDGVGDLEGVRRHLDHLEWLGVDAIWLSPIFTSPMADCGYDVADYCDIDPLFGNMADFDRLLSDAHARGIRVILDWVPNHTSDQHPWFLESRTSRQSAKRDWYYWRDGASPGRPPNNWRCTFLQGPAWTWDPGTRQWYLHTFLPQQPELNWGNPEVVEAMHGTLRFWLDRGVDGFRIDVVHMLGKDPALPDLAPGEALGPTAKFTTHQILRDLRVLLDGYPGDRMMIGEVFLMDTATVASYYGNRDELHLSFYFPMVFVPWSAPRFAQRLTRVAEEFYPRGAWPAWVLSNHDLPRHRTRYGSEARARAAAVLLLTLRGTPFLYAGEELGLEDAVVPPEAVRDPAGFRDGCRAPIPWTSGPDHGWPGAEPWLPWPPEPETRNASAQRAGPGSMAHLYRRLLAARRRSEALRRGSWTRLRAPKEVLAYERVCGGEVRVVAVNVSSRRIRVSLGRGRHVEVASDGAGEGERYSGYLEPDQALILC